jgi:AcrR family transcriptional regulator
VSARASGAATLTEIGGGSRERILDGALELVSRYGISGMSLQLLADHVGLHKSTLFHHFRDKQSLVEEVTRRLMATLAERLRPLAEADPPEIEQVVTIAEDLDDYFAEHPGTALFAMREILGPYDPVHRGGLSPETNRFFGLLGSWLDRARRAGVVRPLSVPQAIVNLMGLALFYPALLDQSGDDLPFGDPRSPETRRRRKRELRETLQRALQPGPAPSLSEG